MSLASSQPLAAPAAVECRRVDYAANQRLLLKHIELNLPSGSTLGIIGPNGGGKTTFIRLLVGLLTPTRGNVRIYDLSPVEATRRGNLIGYLPQLPVIDARLPLSVRQAVLLGLAGKTGLFRTVARDDVTAADEIIEQVGLADSRSEHIGRLSGGQLQRVLIARALVARPALLMMDEPTTGIDAMAQDRFVELIQSLKSRLGLTLIIASHDLRVIGSLCDRVACLNVSMHLHEQQAPLTPEQAHSLLCHFGATLGRQGNK